MGAPIYSVILQIQRNKLIQVIQTPKSSRRTLHFCVSLQTIPG
nr:MAG TPA: hypothetical protein [Caudoviricetes sp.]